MKLDDNFYLQKDVLAVSKQLLGKVLFTNINNKLTGGIITETEAYNGVNDRASHAYGNRKTERTKVMYQPGGIAYIYLCYGIHSLFNVVTGPGEIPTAVLVRAVWPFKNLIGNNKTATLLNGPGKLTKAMGIHYSMTGTALTGKKIWISDEGITIPDKRIIKTLRIGVDYAGKDALLPYRFILEPAFMRKIYLHY